jgi:SAM-dependent methyltransferase
MLQEALLEPLARNIRFKQSLKDIPVDLPIRVADIGCGPKLRFYHYALRHKIKINEYIGVDPLIETSKPYNKNVKIITSSVLKYLPIKDNYLDLVVAFAFLEHIDHPDHILNEAIRIIKPGGKAIFTTPTPQAKFILEFLSYKLKLISEREIREHKNYFTKESLIKCIHPKVISNVNISHTYFELGLNNYLVLTKPT